MSLAIFDFVNELIYPEYCLFCGNIGSYICSKCLIKKLNINFNDICHVCGHNTFSSNLHQECEDSTNLNNLFFFCEYNKAAKTLIEEVKYKGSYSVLNLMAFHMARYLTFKCSLEDLNEFCITSVPSHRYKQNSRGFNQSEILARNLANNLGLKYETLLIKSKNTSKQAGANKSNRNQNLRNTFELNVTNVPENVMIVDDVHTTGATLNECAGVLRKSGCENVVGYTFAKSMKFSSEVLNQRI